MVRDLALSSGVPVAQLLGGNWSVRTVGESNSLVGFLRVKEATAKQLLSVGGMRAIFVARVGKQAVSSDPNPFGLKGSKTNLESLTSAESLGSLRNERNPSYIVQAEALTLVFLLGLMVMHLRLGLNTSLCVTCRLPGLMRTWCPFLLA